MGPNIIQNRVVDKSLSTIDIFPTLLELGDISLKSGIPGKSFASFIMGNNKNLEEQKYVFSETGGLQGPHPSPKEPNVFCIKSPTHKLIYFKTTQDWKLFDLVKDPTEINDLYNTGLNTEDDLKEKLLEWINR